MSRQSIEIEISGDALALLPRLKDDAGLGRAIAREMDFQNQLTVAQIQRGHLSGPTTDSSLSVGKKYGNRLRGSVRASKAFPTATGVESSIGSNVIYAAVHEFGFEGDVQVRPHLRSRSTTQSFKFGGKTVRRKIRGADHGVGTFTRHMNIPARAPFGHGIT